jgi:hypothetical protein
MIIKTLLNIIIYIIDTAKNDDINGNLYEKSCLPLTAT